jgi:molybdate transport system permease protein
MTITARRSRRPAQSPWYFLVPGVLAVGLLALPVAALVAQAPWGDMWQLVTSEPALVALRLSLATSVTATAIALGLGVPLAWLMSRTPVFGSSWVRALVMLPLVLPPVVGGLALLLAFGRRGLVGHYLFDILGVQIPFTTTAVVIAETFVAMPFLVITVEGALRSMDRRYEQAAATLGATRWTVFRRVTLPTIAPSLAAGAVLCWARALGEFGATLTFAGSFPGVTRTLPLAVYAALDVDRSQAIALSIVLLLASVLILVALRGRFLRGLIR